MNEVETLATWDLLKDLGFQPDDECIASKLGPALSFDFGNFKLSASCGMAKGSFREVVVLDGLWGSPRHICPLYLEMPLFFDFVLFQYVKVGVEELDQAKLTPRLRLKYYDSMADAVTDLAKPEDIGKSFPAFRSISISRRPWHEKDISFL